MRAAPCPHPSSRYEGSSHSFCLFQVMLAKGDTTISAKASNLTSLDFDETAQKHEVGIFWPKASSSQRESIVCPIKDWPSDYNRETQFLRKNLKWTDPQILGGVEGPGDAKPNYMMYYDAKDVKSFPNQFANAVSFLSILLDS